MSAQTRPRHMQRREEPTEPRQVRRSRLTTNPGQPHWFHRLLSLILQVVALAATLIILAWHLYPFLVGAHKEEWASSLYVALALQGIAMLASLRDKAPLELRLLFANAVWVAVSRWLWDALDLSPLAATYWAACYCTTFACGMRLNQGSRCSLFGVLCNVFAASFALWSIAGILTVLHGSPIMDPAVVRISVENTVPALASVTFFRTHRNISSYYFVVASGLLLYQCLRGENRHMRWVCALFLPLFAVSVALQRCRANMVGYALVLASLLALLVWRWRPAAQSHWLTRLAWTGLVACAFVVPTGLLYQGLNRMGTAVMCREGIIAANQDPEARAAAERAAAAAQKSGQPLEPSPDSRGTQLNKSTLAGRTAIWATVIPVLRENPLIVVAGQPEETMMDPVNRLLEWPFGDVAPKVSHMHNVLLQQLMEVGLLGAVLYAALFVSLLLRVRTCLAHPDDREAQALLMLAALLVASMTYSMLEPLLTRLHPASSILFVLVAGYFVAGVRKLGDGQPQSRRGNPAGARRAAHQKQ